MSETTTKDYMDRWLLQNNYPEVYVDLTYNANTRRSRITFRQQRFLLAPEILPDVPDQSPFGYFE